MTIAVDSLLCVVSHFKTQQNLSLSLNNSRGHCCLWPRFFWGGFSCFLSLPQVERNLHFLTLGKPTSVFWELGSFFMLCIKSASEIDTTTTQLKRSVSCYWCSEQLSLIRLYLLWMKMQAAAVGEQACVFKDPHGLFFFFFFSLFHVVFTGVVCSWWLEDIALTP